MRDVTGKPFAQNVPTCRFYRSVVGQKKNLLTGLSLLQQTVECRYRAQRGNCTCFAGARQTSSTGHIYPSFQNIVSRHADCISMVSLELANSFLQVQSLSGLAETQRFSRLQYLLEKSSIYSQLLLKRMESQREEKKSRKPRKVWLAQFL